MAHYISLSLIVGMWYAMRERESDEVRETDFYPYKKA